MTLNFCHRLSAEKNQTTLALILAVLIVTIPAAHAQTFTVLHQFTGGADGATPYRGSLITDNQHNVYGSTAAGGDTACDPPFGCGVVFKIDCKSTEKVLHTFTGSPDGAEPYVSIIPSAVGSGYAVAEYGGTRSCNIFGPGGCGAIIKIDASGNETVLYSFTGSPDGAIPQPQLTRDAAGNLYGTTELGGTFNNGTVFKIDPSGSETVLYSFAGSTDGQWPMGGVIHDAEGNLYGTTWFGGAYNSGTVFKLNSAGELTTLHSFGLGSDGTAPFAGLTRDPAGNLYGTTQSGGAHGYGTVFTISPALEESVLHSFAGSPNDGSSPYAAVVVDTKGNLYGTTWTGGINNSGTVFKIDASANETLLHSFQGVDGVQIYGSLVLDATGSLYGTALFGGLYNQGTVFKLTP